MEGLIALLARNLEADEAETFTRDNGLMTFGTEDTLPEFHGSPPKILLFFLVRWRGLTAFSEASQFSVGSLVQEPRTRKTLQSSSCPRALVPYGQPSSY